MKKRFMTYKSNLSDGDRSGPFSAVNCESLLIIHPNGKVALTPDGGIALKLLNGTGSPTVKGEIVQSSTSSNSFNICESLGSHPIGVIYESGIANGSECWIVISGRTQVLLKNSTTATNGNWIYMSDTAGRVNATWETISEGVLELDTHLRQIGHCLETVGAGTNALAYCIINFN